MKYDLENLSKLVRTQFAIGSGSAPDLSALYNQVGRVLSQARSRGEVDVIARHMVDHVGLNHLLPECYTEFQPLVTESMEILLQQLPPERLIQKIVDQLLLAPDVSHGQRLCLLINDMPSLQKLGQIICRSPGLAPEFKQALINLEDNVDTVRYEDLLATIKKEMQAASGPYRFEVEEKILAEASVCAVVAANIYLKGKKGAIESVLKVVKPNVRQNLAHELELYNRLAVFLDDNKSKWGLGDFKFKDTLEQVQWLLENEINLILEQGNLTTAGRYFHENANLVIPERISCSTPSMTVMTRVEGRKITNVDGLSAGQKRRLARALAETCILRPVKDLGDITIFHGDPHAGNIAYTFEKSTPRIIFYDWGMMGRLSRLNRFAMAVMAMGVMGRSPKAVMFAADIVSGGKIFFDSDLKTDIHAAVQKILNRRRTWTGDVLTDIGTLIAEFSYHAVMFPTDLLMFQKTLVTLKGVIADIDPSYDDDQLIWIAMGSHLRDLCRPRYHWKIYKELWALRRYSAVKLLKIQRSIIRSAVELGLAGIKLPLGLHRSESS